MKVEQDPALSLRKTTPAGADGREEALQATKLDDGASSGEARRRELSMRATQAAGPAIARELSLRETEIPATTRESELSPARLGTLETLAPDDAETRRSGALPAPDIDGVESDRIKGAIMAELFGAPATAAKIGRFTVIERLGEGGMGVVYAAYDAQLDRKIAVKLLRRDTVGNDEGARKRLLREAQAMARVSHPNLITVHEVGEHNDSIYVAMEFVKGKSLDVWVAGRPAWREVVAVFAAAGAGLAAAHAAGIVHRDFKPHNVMRADDGAVKVLDFGLARATGATDGADVDDAPRALLDARMTRTGAVMGTPAYMAPEQHEGRVADERSDQYAFCVALYEGLFGRLPFAGETLPELIGNVLAARVQPPPDGAAPRWLVRVVLRGMSVQPGDRYPSMAALLADLARDPERRRRQAFAGVGLSALLVGGGFGLASLSRETGPEPCAGAADELAAVWDAARRTAAHAGLVAAIPTLGETTWAAVGPRLDRRGEAWVAMRTEACLSHRAGNQSDRLLDLRMACLDRRLAGLDAIAAAFTAADPDTVLHAVAAVEGLGDLADCADVERLTAAVPLPADPTRARAVRDQQLALERVAADQLTGHYPAAKAGAEAVATAAASLEYAPLTAEAALARGRAQQELREAEAADASLAAALHAAIRGHTDAVAAEAAARLIFVRGRLLGAPELGLAGADVADALIDRAGEPPLARWLWALNVAIVRVAMGHADVARDHFARAAEVARAAGLEQAAAITVFNEGWLAAQAGDHATAAARFGAGLAAIEASLGAEHPIAAQMRMMLAQARWELGQTARVREMLSAMVPQLLATFGPEAPDVQSAQLLAAEVDLAYRRFEAARGAATGVASHASHPGPAADAARVLGTALVGLGRIDEGLVHLRAAIEKAGEDPVSRFASTTYLGDALLDAGRLDEALASYREATAGFVSVFGEHATLAAFVRNRLARALLARGELTDAAREITAARDSVLAHQPGSPYLAGILATLGEIELARGRPAEAEAALQAAHERYAASFDDDHPERNRARFQLARAVAARSPAEAVPHARAAAAVYTALGDAFAAEAAAVTTWLSRQKL